MAEVHEVRGDSTFYVLRRLRFRQESAWRVIEALGVPDPLEVMDKVLTIEREWSSTLAERETAADGG